MSDPFAPAKLGPLTLRNHIVKAATFEGATPKRVVTDRLIDFHRKAAAGGVGMTTVAYCAVSPDGGTDGRQILLTQQETGLGKLADAIHAEGAAACAQIGHAGPVANPLGNRLPALAPSRILAPIAMRYTKAATEQDIQRVTNDFARGAEHVADQGFDAIEVHLGHNYLLSAFLSPKLNKRRDKYGGSLENRARFPREVVKRVRDAAPNLAITAKLNMSDGVRRGFDVDESIAFATMLQSDGALDAITLTGGSSLANPMYLFRGEAPIEEMARTMPKWMRLGFKTFGRRVFKEYPFEEAYFLPMARRFKEALTTPLVLLGGINKAATIQSALDEGFVAVAMARALLREPDLINRMKADRSTQATCVHCNKCMATIYRGTHCAIDTPDPVL